MTQTEFIQSHGFTGNATKQDWLKLYADFGGSEIFGSEEAQDRDSSLYEGNVEMFNQWFFQYSGLEMPNEESEDELL